MGPPALLHNFRATAIPKSPTFINVYTVFANLYAFLALWSLFLAHLSNFIKENFSWLALVPAKKVTTTTTTKLFGRTVTLDILPSEFPSPDEIKAMEAEMPQCCQHGWFRSVLGHQLHYRFFLPPSHNKPKAVIIWMHGLQGFGGEAHTIQYSDDDGTTTKERKTNMALQAETYLKEGYALYAMDLSGHGFSEGSRWFMPNADLMLKDYLYFIQKVVASRHDNQTPFFLSGYSYGGCLTLKAAKHLQDHPTKATQCFAGCMLQAPASYNLEAFFLFPLAAWIAQHLVNPVLGNNFRPPAWIPNRVHPRRFWRDPERYRVGMRPNGMNPVGRHIPMQTCLTLIQDMVTLRNQIIPNLKVPFCVAHGKQDVVVPIAGTEYLQQASLTPKDEQAVKCFPEAYHDLLGEPEADAVMEFQVKWMKERMAATAQAKAKQAALTALPPQQQPDIHDLIWTDSLSKVLQKVPVPA